MTADWHSLVVIDVNVPHVKSEMKQNQSYHLHSNGQVTTRRRFSESQTLADEIFIFLSEKTES